MAKIRVMSWDTYQPMERDPSDGKVAFPVVDGFEPIREYNDYSVLMNGLYFVCLKIKEHSGFTQYPIVELPMKELAEDAPTEP